MTRYRQKWPPVAIEEDIYHSGVHYKPKFPFYRGKRHTFLRLFEVAKKCDTSAVVRGIMNLNITDGWKSFSDTAWGGHPCLYHATHIQIKVVLLVLVLTILLVRRLARVMPKEGGNLGLKCIPELQIFSSTSSGGHLCLYNVIHIRKAQTKSVPLVPQLTILLASRLARVMPKEGR